MPRAWIARASVIFLLVASSTVTWVRSAQASPDNEAKSKIIIPHIEDYESTLIWIWDEEGPRLEFREGNPKAKKISRPLPYITDSIESG